MTIWSLLFEVVLPTHATIGRGMTADYSDIFYYGACGLAGFWHAWYGRWPATAALPICTGPASDSGQR